MGSAFTRNSEFNRDVSEWDVSKVINMELIFFGSPALSIALNGSWCDNEAAQDAASTGGLTLSDECFELASATYHPATN
jgi:surface protein